MLYWTPDCTHNLIVHWTLALTDSIHLIYIDYDRHMTCGHLILLLTAFITVHFCLHIILVLFQFIVSFTCSHVICTRTFSFTLHAHWVTLPDDLGFARPDVGCFISLIRCSLRSYALQGLGVSPFLDLVFLSSFLSL